MHLPFGHAPACHWQMGLAAAKHQGAAGLRISCLRRLRRSYKRKYDAVLVHAHSGWACHAPFGLSRALGLPQLV